MLALIPLGLKITCYVFAVDSHHAEVATDFARPFPFDWSRWLASPTTLMMSLRSKESQSTMYVDVKCRLMSPTEKGNFLVLVFIGGCLDFYRREPRIKVESMERSAQSLYGRLAIRHICESTLVVPQNSIRYLFGSM